MFYHQAETAIRAFIARTADSPRLTTRTYGLSMISDGKHSFWQWRIAWMWFVAATLFLSIESLRIGFDAAWESFAIRVLSDGAIFTSSFIFVSMGWKMARQSPSTQPSPNATDNLTDSEPVSKETSSEPDAENKEARYRTIVEEQTDLVCCYRPNGEIVYANPAYCRLMGVTRAELVGSSFMPPIVETPILALRTSNNRLDPPNGDSLLEQAMILPDGQVLWVQWAHRALEDPSGQTIEYQVVGRDVTKRRELDQALRGARNELELRVRDRTRELVEANSQLHQEIVERKRAAQALKESEFLFRQLAENIEEVFWVITPSKPGTMYLSPAFEKVWGQTFTGSRAQSKYLESIHPEDRDLFEHAIYRQCLGIKTDVEYRILRPDGSIRWIWDRAFPVRGKNGQIERITGLAQDVTLQKQHDEHARIHLEELAHVSRLSTMGEMASGLAHELNQPLAAINNYCSGCIRRLKAKDGVEPDLIKALESASSEAQRAGEIIRRLRSFVKKRPTEQTRITPRELVLDVIQLAEPEIIACQTRLILEVSSNLPLVEVDIIQIEQVLLNLIRNALEAMASIVPEDRTLTILASSPFPDSIEFAVVDTGPGLTPMVLEQLFRPFFTTKPEGMGLGLAISRSIIEAHGGALWGVSSSASGGARFNFRLTTVPDGPPALTSNSNSVAISESEPDAVTKLIVDLDSESDDESDSISDSGSNSDSEPRPSSDPDMKIFPENPEQHEIRSDDNPSSVCD